MASASATSPVPTGSPGPSPRSTDFYFFALRMMTIGGIISSIAYGVVFTLAVTTASLLHKSTITGKKTVHYAIFAFIAAMLAISSVNQVAAIKLNLKFIEIRTLPTAADTSKNPTAFTIVFATWLSDGFLLWRAIVLYDSLRCVWKRTLHCFIALLLFIQLTVGVLYLTSNFVKALSPTKYSNPIFTLFAVTTLLINWIFTALVVGRLLYFRAKVSKSLGSSYSTPFGRIISMCIESAVLIIVFSTVYIVQNLRDTKRNPFYYSRILLTHIYVIGPLLILFRVAQGKAFLTDSTSFYSAPGNTSSNVRFRGDNCNNTGVNSATTGHSTKIEVNILDEVHKDADDFYDNDYERGRDVEMGSSSRKRIDLPIKM